MKLMVIGASQGLGRAFVEGLPDPGDLVVGVSRRAPQPAPALPPAVELQWIEADMAQPLEAAQRIESQAPAGLDALIYNLGVWETQAFGPDYRFLESDDAELMRLVDINITGALLLLKRLLAAPGRKPQLILTGSTSGLRRSGRPELAFGASKFALSGMADALRESFRAQRLAVTCLQLGYLNTEDDLRIPVAQAAARGAGQLVPLHDVVALTRSLLRLSDAAFVRELVLPAIADERF
ncbi:SDR family oxidoreductase [Roseateles sp. DAIF2]|uniref:SDR family NAD(P)-dependent oxidoreductase n=1 Tax=Roseateles sp. DAIF2 TaxID=2714952 RepID=UPI0018A2D47A|nr:SDR family oxidoreductase [Roseateles sp. DAIF2]QPF74979.1 SDR family oxidoreductase [Roseateles sp. DAIF2]